MASRYDAQFIALQHGLADVGCPLASHLTDPTSLSNVGFVQQLWDFLFTTFDSSIDSCRSKETMAERTQHLAFMGHLLGLWPRNDTHLVQGVESTPGELVTSLLAAVDLVSASIMAPETGMSLQQQHCRDLDFVEHIAAQSGDIFSSEATILSPGLVVHAKNHEGRPPPLSDLNAELGRLNAELQTLSERLEANPMKDVTEQGSVAEVSLRLQRDLQALQSAVVEYSTVYTRDIANWTNRPPPTLYGAGPTAARSLPLVKSLQGLMTSFQEIRRACEDGDVAQRLATLDLTRFAGDAVANIEQHIGILKQASMRG